VKQLKKTEKACCCAVILNDKSKRMIHNYDRNPKSNKDTLMEIKENKTMDK
jgi:hypothetical protein